MSKTIPTQSQIDVVMSDWMGNLRQKEEGNFVHKGQGGIRRQSGESAADYILGDVKRLDGLDLIKHSRMAAEQIVNAIVPEPTKLSVGSDDSYHGIEHGVHHINIATDYFDNKDLTNRQKADIMMGLAAHEAAHGAFTDEQLKKEKLEGVIDNTTMLRKEIWNVIEDERIEFLLGEKCPGFASSVGKTKGYYFKQLKANVDANVGEPTEPLPRLLNTLIQAVRYPSELTEEQVKENFDELESIRRILTPYPLTPEGAWDATDRVMDVIRDMAKEKAKQEKQQQQQQQQQSAGGQGQQQQQPASGQGQQDGQQPSSGPDGKGQDAKQKKEKAPTKAEIQKALSQMLDSQQTQGMLGAMKKDNEKSSGSKTSSNLNMEEALEYVNEDDSECTGAGGGNPDTFVFKPEGDADAYNDALGRVRPFVPAMKKALTCRARQQDYTLQGMPSGKLNCNKLASLQMGNTRIFTRSGSVTSSSASVIMLIDESGSMGGSRMLAARDAAVLVKEALDRVNNVRFFCYGYTSRTIRVYAENARTAKWALGGTRARGGTPTGDAMRIISERVRKYTQSPCLMLVLTDGDPDNNNKVRQQDKELPLKQIYPVGVGIQSTCVRNGFKEYIVIDDMSRFAEQMGRLTRGKLEKMLVRKESEN